MNLFEISSKKMKEKGWLAIGGVLAGATQPESFHEESCNLFQH